MICNLKCIILLFWASSRSFWIRAASKSFQCKCKSGDSQGLTLYFAFVYYPGFISAFGEGLKCAFSASARSQVPIKEQLLHQRLCLDVTANFRAARPLSKVGEDKITLKQPSLLTQFGFVCPSNNTHPTASNSRHSATVDDVYK